MIKLISLVTVLFLVDCEERNDSSESSDTVTAFKSKGAVQCGSPGMTAHKSAQLLTNNGFDVVSSHCGIETNLGIAAVCGAATINVNIHEIRISNLSDAEDLDYRDVTALENESTGAGYEIVECKNP
jgi:hypothetical protein